MDAPMQIAAVWIAYCHLDRILPFGSHIAIWIAYCHLDRTPADKYFKSSSPAIEENEILGLPMFGENMKKFCLT